MPIIIPWAEQLAEDEGVADLIMLSKQTMVHTVAKVGIVGLLAESITKNIIGLRKRLLLSKQCLVLVHI